MDKGIKQKVAVMFICLVAGGILSIQYKTNKSISAVNIPVHRSQEIAAEYRKLEEEREELLREISSLEQKVKIYESEKSDEDEFLEALYSEIEKYKMLSGYKALVGRGVSVKLEEPMGQVIEGNGKSVVVQHYDTISEIINVLNAAEAEAISINDQRYTAFTEIVPAGNHIEINGVSYGPPFIIKALGNPQDLENSLRLKGGVVWLMEQQYNIQVQIAQEDRIQVPRYTKNIEYRYSESTQE
jgi:uncharacterized protein YlxW (UPF0749 family)